MKDQLIIFDTTLRDGEQSPGASMNMQEKFRLAQQLGEALARIVGEAAGLAGLAVVGTQQALEGGQIHWCELAFGVFGLPLLSKPEANN